MTAHTYKPTNDKRIRKILLNHLKANSIRTKTRIVEELGINHGACRIDVAVINGVIHGYELKSDKDTLDRLPKQVQAYNLVVDKATLVVSKKHLFIAMHMVPDWWGITLAKTTKDNNVDLIKIRGARKNPKKNSFFIASLLWKNEVVAILNNLGITKIKHERRNSLYKKLSSTLSLDSLSFEVKEKLIFRKGWRVDQPRQTCDDLSQPLTNPQVHQNVLY